MTEKLVRTPTKATGGITDEERAAMLESNKDWTALALRTETVDRAEATEAIQELYECIDEKPPVVLFANSPAAMAFMYGTLMAMLYNKKITPDYQDVQEKFEALAGSENLGKEYKELAISFGGEEAINKARDWYQNYNGGAYWAGSLAFFSAMRDIIGLKLPEYEKYAYYERAAKAAPFRVYDKQFCVVSDFPDKLVLNNQNQAHCENGPSHKWRDGLELYHWNGTKVPKHWIMDRENLDPNEVIQQENVELRAVGTQIVTLPKMLHILDETVVHDSGDPDVGALIELTLPGLEEPGRFLKAVCPRNGVIIEGVPRVSDIDNLPIDTAWAAQAWRIGDPQSEYEHPGSRT